MGRAIALLFALGVSRVSASAGTLNGIQSLIEQRSGASQLELRSIMSRLSVRLDNMSAVLELLRENITQDIQERIEEDHNDTQQEIDSKLQAVISKTTDLVADKSNADSLDEKWQKCIEEEKALFEEYEEVNESLAPLTLAEKDARDAMEAKEMVSIDPAYPEFSCDLSKDTTCQAELANYDATKNSMNGQVKQEQEVSETTFIPLYLAHSDALKALSDQEKEWTDLRWDLIEKMRDVCDVEHYHRDEAICKAGRSFQDKCSSVRAYDNLIADVEKVNGNAWSHPDRVNEWRVTQMALCLVELLVQGDEEIDDASLDACEAKVNYEQVFGDLQKWTANYTAQVTAEKFTCTEQDMTFYNGMSWNFPRVDGYDVNRVDDMSSSTYSQSPVTYTLNYDLNDQDEEPFPRHLLIVEC